MEYEIRIFDPKVASEDLIDSFVSLEIELYREEYPEDPIPSKEDKKKALLLPDPNLTIIYWIAYVKDQNQVIGSVYLRIYEKKHPGYESNKHMAFLHIVVTSEFRRKGIGTSILRKVLVRLKKENKSIVQGGSQIESGKSFCVSLDGQKAMIEEESRLNFDNVDWNMIDEWRKEGKDRALGVTIENFERVPDQDIEDFCKLFTHTLNLIPKGELEWEGKITPEIRRESESRYVKLKTLRTTFVSKEEDGTISGLTETFLFNDRPTLLYQGLTGVKKEYQERGLGKWLKAEMLFYCREKLPNVKFVATDFALVNKPMIAINRKLGFKHYKTWVDYKFSVKSLTKTVSQ